MAEPNPDLVEIVHALARRRAREDHRRERRNAEWLARVKALEGRDQFANAAVLAREIERYGAGEPFRRSAIRCRVTCERAITGAVELKHKMLARNALCGLRCAIEETLPT